MIIGTVPSPNGLVLNKTENILFVAVTRGNAVWRLPLMGDGSVSKAGIWIQLSGGHGGPDGMALDEEGGLICAHAGMGVWRFDHLGRPTHFMCEPGSFTTNAAFGGWHRQQAPLHHQFRQRHDRGRRYALRRQEMYSEM